MTSDSENRASIMVSSAVRGLRRQLRPVAWMVLEEIALDSATDQGRLVARTSARRVAEQLGIDPGTAAGALRLLRDRGLVRMERQAGDAGRFGLAVYVLGTLDGLTIMTPSRTSPSMANPATGKPGVAGPGRGKAVPADADQTTPAASPAARRPKTPAGPRQRDPVAALPAVEGQTELDLGLGTA